MSFVRGQLLGATALNNAFTQAVADAVAAVGGNFVGVYTSLGALAAAQPAGASGKWAILLGGPGTPASFAAWDADESVAAWVNAGVIPISHVTGLQAALDAKLDDSQAVAYGLSLLAAANAAAARTLLEAYSSAQVDTALALKANLASPTFTDVPAAPTASLGTNTTQIATMAAIQAAIADLINSAPGALNTLDELANALGDDASFAATMTSALALKAPLASPTFTGTPAAPTPSAADNSTKIATTAYVDTADALKANLASPALTGSPTVPNQTAGIANTVAANTAYVDAAVAAAAIASVRGALSGMVSSRNSNTVLDITVGACRDDSNAANIVFAAAKSIDTAGTGAGGLDTGALAASTTYHVFAISKADGTSAGLLSLSATAPTMPATYIYKRRIWSVLTNGSTQFIKFKQDGDFCYTALIAAASNTVATSITTTPLLGVPSGIVVLPRLYCLMQQNAAGDIVFNVAPGDDSTMLMPAVYTNIASDRNMNNFIGPRTDTTRNVYIEQIVSSGTIAGWSIATHGWIDTRGKDA